MEKEEKIITFADIRNRIEKKKKYLVDVTATEIIVRGEGKAIHYSKIHDRYHHIGFADQADFVSSGIFREWYALIQAYKRERNVQRSI